MPANRCPHCGRPALSPARKLLLGPSASAACRACGGRVGVAFGKAWAALSPGLLVAASGALIAHASIRYLPSILLLDALALLAMGAAYLWWVPLQRR